MGSFPRAWIIVAAVAILATAAGVYISLQPEEEAAPEALREMTQKVIGTSVEGRSIEAHTFGDGRTHLLFVGGIHGGYEWNSVLLAYEFIDYLDEHPEAVPDDIAISVVPNGNPDGVFAVVGKEGRFTSADVTGKEEIAVSGRFNANDVDLNRNFDCKWQPESFWRGNTVSAGTSPFSEPEARAIRDFVYEIDPAVVVFWHSQADAVYASECEEGILAGTRAALDAYANASGYKAVDSFDAYEVTGDAEGWLASIGIPALTVELSTHQAIEWEQNLDGVQALISLYSIAR